MKSNFSACQFENALRFAAEAHLGQPIPGSAIPYLAHVFLVAVEVINHLDDIPDEDPDLLVQTALLHDVLEDTMTTREEIRAKFGEEVEYCVFLLSKEIRSECGKKKELDEYLDDLANGRAPRRSSSWLTASSISVSRRLIGKISISLITRKVLKKSSSTSAAPIRHWHRG